MRTYINIVPTGPKCGQIGTCIGESDTTITLEYKSRYETTTVKYPKSILHYFVKEVLWI